MFATTDMVTESATLIAVVVVSGVLFKFVTSYTKMLTDMSNKFETALQALDQKNREELKLLVNSFQDQIQRLDGNKQLLVNQLVELVVRSEKAISENTLTMRELLNLLKKNGTNHT